MEFTPTTAGTIAQIIAVLLLAVAFAPELRGSLAKKWVKGDDGNLYWVASNPSNYWRPFAIYRIVGLLRVLVTLRVRPRPRPVWS